jgi:hypothetical protein
MRQKRSREQAVEYAKNTKRQHHKDAAFLVGFTYEQKRGSVL